MATVDKYVIEKDNVLLVGVLYSSSSRWYTKHKNTDLLYYYPLVKYMQDGGKLNDLVSLEGPYNWQLTEKGKEVFFGFKSHIPITSIYSLKLAWIPINTKFVVYYDNNREFVRTIDSIEWHTA